MKRIVALAGLAALLSACGSGEENASDPETEAAAPEPGEEPVVEDAAPTEAPLTAPVSPEAADPAPTTNASLMPRIPLFNATCGTGIEVHANEGGPVFIDGEETSLKKFNDNYFEASRDGTTISISFNPDGSLNLSFTGPNRANGICTLK